MQGRRCARLSLRGPPIGDFGKVIAAHALALDAATVADKAKHFKRVDGLVLENRGVRDPGP